VRPRSAKRLAWSFAGTLGLLLMGTTASADTSVWTRAAKPSTRSDEVLLARVDGMMNDLRQLQAAHRPTTFRQTMLLRRVRRTLEQAGAASSPSVTLRMRLATVYQLLYPIEGDPERLVQAATHLEWASHRPLPALTKAGVLNSLAICFARLGRHAPETEAYDRAIALQPDPEMHSMLMANKAEGQMAQGAITRAIQAYRAALATTPSFRMMDSGTTTMWGLAVALDRSGDLEAALEQIGRARSYDPIDQFINGPNWFYVPPYDEDWYAALGHWQRARSHNPSKANDLGERVQGYDAAIAAWRSYMNRAPLSDRWLPLAALRLRVCEQERLRLRDRVSKDEAARAARARGKAPSKDPLGAR
jgi:tetratricopeptide (TPR) repeat protein